MKLYEINPSFNSRKVRAVAAELGIALEIVNPNTRQGEHKQPAFLAKNPNGKLPVLEDGDYVLWESNAILNYLADSRPDSALSPATPRQRAEINRWLFWDASHLNKAVGGLFFEKVVKGLFGGGGPDEAKLAQHSQDLRHFAAILDAWLADREYVAGSLSVADFSLASDLAVRKAIGLELTELPHLQAWLDRVEARDSWKASEPSWMPAVPGT